MAEHTVKKQHLAKVLGDIENLKELALDVLYTNGSQGLAYSVGSEACICTGIGNSTETDIEIASMVRGIPVEGTKMKAFENCDTITSVIIPDGATNIRNSTFANCINLVNVSIGHGLKMINTVFDGCTNLKTITLPKSIIMINTNSFRNCTSLTDVYYRGTEEQWNSITIASGNEALTNATIHYNWEGDI